MKNFNYTARDKSGATKRGSLQAADRNAAMQELSSQGMVPLSVIEGNAVTSSGLPGWSPLRMVFLAIVGLGVVIGLVIWLRTPPGKISTEKKPQKATQAKRAVLPRAANMKTNSMVRAQGDVPDPLRTAQQAAPSAQTNHTKTLSSTNVAEVSQQPKRPADYPSGLEQVMNWIVNKRLGDSPFFLPKLSQKENIAEILERDLVVYDDDTEDKIQAKANVAQAKLMLKEYIAKGGKPEDFLQYFHSALLEANREWKDAQKQVSTMMQSGDYEEARAYAEEANKRLAEKGIKPVVGPK
jgi:hypothetical protein